MMYQKHVLTISYMLLVDDWNIKLFIMYKILRGEVSYHNTFKILQAENVQWFGQGKDTKADSKVAAALPLLNNHLRPGCSPYNDT